MHIFPIPYLSHLRIKGTAPVVAYLCLFKGAVTFYSNTACGERAGLLQAIPAENNQCFSPSGNTLLKTAGINTDDDCIRACFRACAAQGYNTYFACPLLSS
jgi:hypothetical protein